MERINTSHASEFIEWEQFLSYFCRRGQLRDSEKIIFQFRDLNAASQDQGDESERYYFIESDDDNLEEKKERLQRSLKEKLINKQNAVSKDGKGKYDVTVPVLFEFLKNPNERKSTR